MVYSLPVRKADIQKMQGIETRLNAYGPLYVEKQPKYWLNLAESFIKARNATTGAPMF